MNYALLTVAVESLAGRSLGSIMETRIFAPLTMEQTVFLAGPQQQIPGRATGYRAEAGRWVRSVDDAP